MKLLVLFLFFLSIIFGDNVSTVPEDAIFDFVDIGDIQSLEFIIVGAEQIHLLNYQNNAGHTLLHWACSKGQIDIAKWLLHMGADLSIANQVFNGFQALHWASSNGYENIVRILIDHGAILEVKDFNGRTPLHLACERGHRNIALILIENGASIVEESNDFKTPLHYASFSGLLPVVQLILDRDIDVNIKTKWGDTALHYASSGQTISHIKIIQLLLNHGADVDALGMQGDTPFHWACWKGLGTVAELLVKHGADMHWGGYTEAEDATPFSLGSCELEPLRSKLLAAYDEATERWEREDAVAAAAMATAKDDKSQLKIHHSSTHEEL